MRRRPASSRLDRTARVIDSVGQPPLRARRGAPAGGFLRAGEIRREAIASADVYPFDLPALRGLTRVELAAGATLFIGENGSGKSTLLEALVLAAGFNPEGGSVNFRFAARPSESALHDALRLVRGARRPRSGFFFRAETFFNVATEIEQLGLLALDGGRSFHEQSHGESFVALVRGFAADGLYVLDEPEAAMSPTGQLAMLAVRHDLVEAGAQVLVATRSPILLALPGATILEVGPDGIAPVPYEAAGPVQIYRAFLADPPRVLEDLLAR